MSRVSFTHCKLYMEEDMVNLDELATHPGPNLSILGFGVLLKVTSVVPWRGSGTSPTTRIPQIFAGTGPWTQNPPHLSPFTLREQSRNLS